MILFVEWLNYVLNGWICFQLHSFGDFTVFFMSYLDSCSYQEKNDSNISIIRKLTGLLLAPHSKTKNKHRNTHTHTNGRSTNEMRLSFIYNKARSESHFILFCLTRNNKKRRRTKIILIDNNKNNKRIKIKAKWDYHLLVNLLHTVAKSEMFFSSSSLNYQWNWVFCCSTNFHS